MTNTGLIAKHIDLLECDENEEQTCKICGKATTHYFTEKKVLSEKFNDFDYCKNIKSSIVCVECASCIKNAALRRSCFYADESKLVFFKKDDTEKILFNMATLVKKPFVFCFTQSFKKHNTFKAKLNYSTSHFVIQSENEQFLFDMEKHKDLFYNILKPAYFELLLSKDELLTGNYMTLVDPKELFRLDKQLFKYRGTPVFEFLVFILNSNERNEILKKRKEELKNARKSKRANKSDVE